MHQSWSTERLPEREQFDHWSAISAEAFCPVTVTREQMGAFPSTVGAHAVGGLGVSTISTRPQGVARTEAQVQANPGDSFFLNLPLTPGTFARQDGRTAELRPGDFTIVDSARPFELGFRHDLRQVSLKIPAEMLARRGIAPMTTARRVDGSRGLGAVASQALRAAAADAHPLDRHTARALADHLCGLIALALVPDAEPTRRTAREQLLESALGHIEQRLGEPSLSPRQIAEQIAVSPRYLHRLFAERGTSFGRWLLEQRLVRARDALDDPACAHRTIADIAHEVGFQDPSYFARAFRARYGTTPRAARERALVA